MEKKSSVLKVATINCSFNAENMGEKTSKATSQVGINTKELVARVESHFR